MNIIAELHCHTNVSGHAFNSLTEMARRSRELGLYAMAVTNHAHIRDTLTQIHFGGYRYQPRQIEGIYLLSGVEANISDLDGHVDVTEKVLAGLDFRIASKHDPDDMVYPARWGSVEENTQMYLGVIQQPEIDCIGHCGNAAVPFLHEAVIPAAAENGMVVEVNTSYLKRSKESAENYVDIVRLCKKYQARVAVTTDSHSIYTMGEFQLGIQLLEEAGYPEALVINSSPERLRAYFRERKGRDIFEDQLCLG